MNGMKKLIGVAVLVHLFGCASVKLARMDVTKNSEAQTTSYVNGMPQVAEQRPKVAVYVHPTSNTSGTHAVLDHLDFMVQVNNLAADPFDFSEQNVRVLLNNAVCYVPSAAEVEQTIRSKANTARTWAAIAGALGGMSASGYWQQQNESAKTSANFQAISAYEAQAVQSLDSLLKRTTVPPGGEAHGWVRAMTPDARPNRCDFIVVVDVIGEQFVFKFNETALASN